MCVYFFQRSTAVKCQAGMVCRKCAGTGRGEESCTKWTTIVFFLSHRLFKNFSTELVFLNVYGAQELIPRSEFRQPM